MTAPPIRKSQNPTGPLHGFRIVLAALVTLLPSGCVGPRAAQGITTDVEQTATVVAQREARELVDRLIPAVERIRGLQFNKPVPVEVVSPDQTRAHFMERLDKFDLHDVLQAQQRAFTLLGILPEGTDMLETLVSFVEAQAGAFYDPGSGKFFIVDNVPASGASVIIVHELVHALEDQHYDLDARVEAVLDDDDASFVVGALHEGSATLAMNVYTMEALSSGELDMQALQELAEMQERQSASIESTPPAIVRPLLGSYILGAQFLGGGVQAAMVATEFPVDRVNASFEDGPRSSEQILHPKKFWDADSRDEPVEVELVGIGGVLGDGWELVRAGVLGEIGIGDMTGASFPRGFALATAGGEAWTTDAAQGWDGDRWQLWHADGNDVVVLASVWDSSAEAAEFERAVAERSGFETLHCGSAVAVVAGAIGDRGGALLAQAAASAGCPDEDTPVE